MRYCAFLLSFVFLFILCFSKETYHHTQGVKRAPAILKDSIRYLSPLKTLVE